MKEFLKLFFLCVFIFPAQLIVSEISPHQPITVNQRHAKLETLLFTIEKRLAIMHEITRIKWNLHLPIQDLSREQELLDSLFKQRIWLRT